MAGLLTEGDRELVRFIGQVGAAAADNVRVAMCASRTFAYRRLGRCVEARVLVPVRLLYGEPALYVATRTGLRWVDLGELPVTRIGAGRFAHLQACARLAAAFHATGSYEVLAEHCFRARQRERGELIASATLDLQGRRLHHPDLLLTDTATGERVAVEIELTAKAPRRLREICRAWGYAHHLSAVRYYASPIARRALLRAVEATGTADRIDVRPLPWQQP